MKAILVIDIKEDTDIKTLRANLEVYENIHIKPCHQSNYQFREGLELKPLPKEEDIYEVGIDEEDTNAKRQWNKGWNACLDEIVGETE